MPRTYEFVQLDVFTRSAFAGNPLAIFTDGRGLTDAQMQALAREMNLSETTFILPRDRALEAEKGTRVRIFTVGEELPFAGHPTLGTALYLYSMASPTDHLSLDLNVGKIDISFRTEAQTQTNRVEGNVFGEMRQREPEFGGTLPRGEIAVALRVRADQLGGDPAQVVSTGFPFAIVPIRDLAVLAELHVDLARIGELLDGTAARFCYFIAPEQGDDWRRVRARMFFYGGEDPATGSAAGCAVSWIVRNGLTKSDEHIVIWQGVEAKRPSEIFVRATREGEHVTNVRVGGYAVEVLRGVVTL